MVKVPSFSVEHTTMKAGLYLRENRRLNLFTKIKVWDLRFVAPSEKRYLTSKALHTIEHIFAFKLREVLGDKYISTFPFGCHEKGTKVLMYDGSLKNIEDVVIGDLVMGIDSTPRKVTNLHRGTDNMFKVSQSNAEPYIVSGDHILSLVYNKKQSHYGFEKGDILNIPVREFLKQTSSFQSHFRGYKRGFDLKSVNFKLDPYILGLWLGDGVRCKPCLCVCDDEPELAQTWIDFGKSLGMHCNIEPDKGKSKRYWLHNKRSGGQRVSNPFMEILKELNLYKNKHIPECYFRGSVAQRFMLLAGLINSDGWCSSRGSHNRRSVNFGSTNLELVNGVARLANSLGLYSRIKCVKGLHTAILPQGERVCQPYYHVTVAGDLSPIMEVLLPKKRPQLNHNYDKSKSIISITPEGVGEFYGITLDGDQLYLLSDGTVQHNCTTGFGFISKSSLTFEELREALIEVIEHTVPIISKNEIPALTEVECGRPTLFCIREASSWLHEYLHVLKNLK